MLIMLTKTNTNNTSNTEHNLNGSVQSIDDAPDVLLDGSDSTHYDANMLASSNIVSTFTPYS